MSDLPPDGLFGRIALHYRLITHEQLSEATRIQSREGGTRPLGQILVDQGWITDARRKQLLDIQQQYLDKNQGPSLPGQTAPRPEPPAASPAPAAATVAAAASPPEPGGELLGSIDDAGPLQSEPAPALEISATPAATPTIDFEQASQPDPATRAPASPPPAPGPDAPGPEAPEVAPAASVSAEEPRSLLEILGLAVGEGASDVHLHTGSTPRIRVAGNIREIASERLDDARVRAHLEGLLSDEHLEALDRDGQVDGAYSLPGVGRFRLNAYKQQQGTDVVLRVIPAQPPTLQELNLPQQLAQFTNYHQGLVLITGPAGCGKSATMAALINLVNEERREHVITGEDPIEIIHPSNRCLINQRQVGEHSESFAKILRAALREDPDVIALGDLRDLETISLALSAAETGHLVFATLHTGSATQTINRLIGAFPPNQQDQIRVMVSESLRAIISQRLVTKADGTGQVPALEILVANRAVGNLIRENKTFQIESIMQTGSAQGMVLLEASLRSLVAEKTITAEEADRHR